MPASALPLPDEVSAQVLLEFPETGGHVSFIAGPFPGNLRWLPRRVIAFLADSAAIRISEADEEALVATGAA